MKNLLLKSTCVLMGMIFANPIFANEEKRVSTPRVIYGDDNRYDVFQVPDYWKSKALSTVAFVSSMNLEAIDSINIKVKGVPFGLYKNACTDEPFWSQQTSAFCSGFIVAPNVIMTAGHCVQSANFCQNTKFLLGWGEYYPSQNLSSISSDQVYSCKSVIKFQNNFLTGLDYGLVELDRPIYGVEPLELRSNGSIAKNEKLVVIGHPSGLPTKVASGAVVRDIKEAYFVSNLDTYGGNSGSPVFNEDTGFVEGILVRGEKDFVYNRERKCFESNRCADHSCRGEDVTRIDVVLQKMFE